MIHHEMLKAVFHVRFKLTEVPDCHGDIKQLKQQHGWYLQNVSARELALTFSLYSDSVPAI